MERRGHLKVNPDEADVVKLVFDTFLQEENLTRTAIALNARGIQLPRRRRTGSINIDMVHNILRNKSYAGIRKYKARVGQQSGEAKAVWEPIIAQEKFEMVQAMLDRNRHHKRSYLDQRYPYTLSGICFCATCSDRMSGKSAHSKGKDKVPYYEHSGLTKRQYVPDEKILRCDPPRIPAVKLEPLVWQEVKRFLNIEAVADQCLTIAKVLKPDHQIRTDEDHFRKQLQANERQMDALADRIARLPKNVDEQVFLSLMAKLQDEKKVIERKLVEFNKSKPAQEAAIDYDNFAQFAAHLKELLTKADTHPDIRSAIIRQLVHRIEVTTTGFTIEFYVSKTDITREPAPSGSPFSPSPVLAVLNGAQPTKSLDTHGLEVDLGEIINDFAVRVS